MGLISRLLSFVRVPSNHSGKPQSDVKVNPSGGDNITAEHFADAGDDAFPLEQDYVSVMGLGRSGRGVAIGYADVVNQPRAEKGDKRIYGRKSDDGTWINEVWLKNDGTIFINNTEGNFSIDPDGNMTHTNAGGMFTQLSNGFMQWSNVNGFIQLQVGGDILANGAKITKDGDFVTSDGKSMRNHTHSQPSDSNGDSEAETNPPS